MLHNAIHFSGALGHRRSTWLLSLTAALIALSPIDAAAARYAFLVGVGKYTTKELKELPYTENDVTALRGVLASAGYDVGHNVVTLTLTAGAKDPRYLPIAKNVRDEFRLLLGTLTKGDSLLVALAGHGVQFRGEKDSYFCPADCDLGDRSTLISLQDLYDDLDQRCKASVKVLLVDACRNDPVAARSQSRDRVALDSVTRPQQIPLPGGVAALFSCSAGQQAFFDDEYRQGIFFYHVVHGLQGPADLDGDAVVTLGELEMYIRPRIEARAREKVRAAQTPDLRLNQSGQLTLAELTITNSIGMKLRAIPPGEFLMGTDPQEVDRLLETFPEASRGWFDGESPQHLVRITRPFYLGIHEVTFGQFGKFVEATDYQTEAERDGKGGYGWNEEDGRFEGPDPKYTWRNPGWPQTDDHPVVNVSWNDAVEFCKWLSRAEGLQYRLPTEAEWEYACRAGSTTWYSHGNDPDGLSQVANTLDATAKEKLTNYPDSDYIESHDGFVFTAPAGRFVANGFGLYDMHGNVWEWCADWYDGDYYRGSPTVDPTGPSEATFRVSRGGSWNDSARICRSAYRNGNTPDSRSNDLGFRVARGPSGQ